MEQEQVEIVVLQDRERRKIDGKWRRWQQECEADEAQSL